MASCDVSIDRYVEQSNSLMEKTNDSFKLTATQSQQRVLELEQEKVKKSAHIQELVISPV